MTQRALSAILLVFCTAMPAAGGELALDLGATAEYDSNVFRRQRNTEDDFLFTLRPGFRLYEDHGDDVNFSFGYQVPVEFAAEFNDELNDVDHIADGRVDYHVNERVLISVQDRFRYLRSTLRHERVNPDEVALDDDLPSISEERDRVTLNDGSVALRYLFAPRLEGRAVVTSSFFDSTRDDRSRNYSLGGQLGSDYRLSQQHQVGGGVRYTFQDFDDREGIAGSQTHTTGLFGSWRWLIDETTNLSVTAGPSLLVSDQERSDSNFVSRPVPFELLPAGGAPAGFRDRNNDLIDAGTPIGPRSMAVSSYQTDPGMVNNCDLVNGTTVSPCGLNVLFDSNDPTDAATIAAILNGAVPITNPNTAGGSGEQLTIFAEVVLSKRWTPTVASALRYSRSQGDASGLGGTVIADSISLSTNWDFARRWQLALRGDWIKRESTFDLRQTRLVTEAIDDSDIPGGTFVQELAGFDGTAFNTTRSAGIETDRWGVAARVTHQLFRSTLVFAQVRYDEQRSDPGTLGRSSDFENVLGVIGVRHTFEPIKLW